MQRMNIRRRMLAAVASVAVAAGFVGVSLVTSAAPASAAPPSVKGGSIIRSEVMARAESWLATNPVTYNPDAYDKPDSGGTRNYRRDCSGLVDMAWHLNADPNSYSLGSTAYSHSIALSALRPGDILVTPGHVVLFARWAPAYPKFEYYSFGSNNIKYRNGDLSGAATASLTHSGQTFSGNSANQIDGHTTSTYSAWKYKRIYDGNGMEWSWPDNYIMCSTTCVKSGNLVKAWQSILWADGRFSTTGNIDGGFGPLTQTATQTWQSMNGLGADGEVGPNTWTKAETKIMWNDGGTCVGGWASAVYVGSAHTFALDMSCSTGVWYFINPYNGLRTDTTPAT